MGLSSLAECRQWCSRYHIGR